MSGGTKDQIAQRLRTARLRAGYISAARFAERIGVSDVTYRSHENGLRGIPYDTAGRYAKALRISLAWLLTGEGAAEGVELALLKPLRVTQFVEAGRWMKHPDLAPAETYLIGWPNDRRYKSLKAVAVRDDSMNKAFVAGDTLIVCPVEDSRHKLQSGNLVVVQRRSADGLIERLARGYEIDEDGQVWLVPYSTQHGYSAIRLPASREAVTEAKRRIVETAVIGLVVGIFPDDPPQYRD